MRPEMKEVKAALTRAKMKIIVEFVEMEENYFVATLALKFIIYIVIFQY